MSGNANVDVNEGGPRELANQDLHPRFRGDFQSIADPISELQQVYRSGLALTTQNLGAPSLLPCRHVADGTLAHIGLAAEYVQALSAQGENITDRQFQVFDGPGGGLVETGISVNPGDQVTVHAEGQVW